MMACGPVGCYTQLNGEGTYLSSSRLVKVGHTDTDNEYSATGSHLLFERC
jgi:hypothetical protein